MSGRGFFAPVNLDLLTCRPLSEPFSVSGGTIAGWLRRNSESSIPHGIDWMHRGHYIDNLERAADRLEGGFTGMHWMDSDLYKLLEAIAWDIDGTADADRFLDETTDLLARAQLDDGYLNSYYQVADPAGRWSDFAFGHEMYLGGHLIQAGVAASRARGDRTLLEIGHRFADHLWTHFGPSGSDRIDGHPEIEIALVELFRETGDEKYLDLARLFLDRRGRGLLGPGHFGHLYCQDEVPFRERTELTGHAVRAVYLAIGATDIAIETGDDALLDLCTRLWHHTVDRKAYLTGGVGSRHFHEALGAEYELPPDRAYQETCASIAMAWWSHRLLMVSGEDVFAEHLQRTTVNAIAAGVSQDGRHFFYRNPLMQRTLEPRPPEGGLLEERVDIGTRASWYNTACCPPNLMRFFASLPHLMAHEQDGAVDIALPDVGGIAVTLSDGSQARARIAASSPAKGTMRIECTAGKVTVRPSMVRPPVTLSAAAGGGTYSWEPGPVIVRAHPRVDAVRGQVAVVYADSVYALEGRQLEDPDELGDLHIDIGSVVPRAAVLDDDGRPTLRASVDVWAVSSARSFTTDAQVATVDATREVELIPWARWAEDEPTTMRVWIAERGPDTPGATA